MTKNTTRKSKKSRELEKSENGKDSRLEHNLNRKSKNEESTVKIYELKQFKSSKMSKIS